jgi:hypothetical protein
VHLHCPLGKLFEPSQIHKHELGASEHAAQARAQ